MSSEKYKISCEKCRDLKTKKAEWVKARGDQNSRRDNRKRSRTTWRKSTNLSNSKLRVHHITKRFRKNPSYDSVCDVDDYATDKKITWDLSRKMSSSDYESTHLDMSTINDLECVSSMTLTEDRRSKKIRFKIPEGTLGYEDAKKAMWRSEDNESTNPNMIECIGLKRYPSYYQKIDPCTSSFGRPTESIQEILPVLKRLQEDDGVIKSELDLNKIAGYIKENEKAKRQKSKKNSRKGK